jgi:predicted porin
MKKLLLAATVATLTMSAAQAAPTVYGKLNVTVDNIDNNDFKDESLVKVNSNASRIGVKGEEKITDELSAVYLAEWALSTDGGGSDTDLSMRNRFVGIKANGVGTLKVGQFDSYFKTAAGNNQDIFNDHTELDMTKVLAGEERLNNVIGFETDKKLLGGLAFNIMFQQGESSTATSAASGLDAEKRDGFGDSVSGSITYENKDMGLAAAVAANRAVAVKYNGYTPLAAKIYSDAVRVTGSLDLTPMGVEGLVFGGLWQTTQPTDDTVTAGTPAAAYKGLQEDAYGVTAAYTIPSTPVKLKAQYISSTTEAHGFEDHKQDLYGLGLDYQINKQAKFYSVVGQQKRDWLKENDTKTTIGLGMEYNF